MTVVLQRLNKPYFISGISLILIVLGVISSIFMILAFLINIISIFFASDQQEAYYQIIFLIPYAAIFKLNPGSASLFTYLVLFLVVRVLFSIMWIDKKFLFSWILWMAYVFAGSAGGYSNAIKQCIIPCVIYGYFATGKPNLKSFIFYYFAGLVSSSIVALFIEQIPNMSLYVSYDMAYELDDVVRFSGLYTDPNYYSLAIMLVWSSLIVLYLYGEIKSEIFLFTVILIFFGIQTVSKSFLLMLTVMCLGLVFFLFQKKKYKIAIVLSVGIIIACILVFFGQIHIFDNVLERLFSGNDLTTGRTEIWGDFFEIFYENPLYVLVGAGSGAGYVDGHPAHNTYIDFIYYYGLCGTFLFGVSCFYASANERFSKSISSFLPGIAMILMFGFLSCLIYYDFSFTLLAILVAGKTELNPETKGANWKNGNSADWSEYESDGNIR